MSLCSKKIRQSRILLYLANLHKQCIGLEALHLMMLAGASDYPCCCVCHSLPFRELRVEKSFARYMSCHLVESFLDTLFRCPLTKNTIATKCILAHSCSVSYKISCSILYCRWTHDSLVNVSLYTGIIADTSVTGAMVIKYMAFQQRIMILKRKHAIFMKQNHSA